MNRRQAIAMTAEEQEDFLAATEPSAHDVPRRQTAKRVAVRAHPERVTSWDHSTLGGAY